MYLISRGFFMPFFTHLYCIFSFTSMFVFLVVFGQCSTICHFMFSHGLFSIFSWFLFWTIFCLFCFVFSFPLSSTFFFWSVFCTLSLIQVFIIIVQLFSSLLSCFSISLFLLCFLFMFSFSSRVRFVFLPVNIFYWSVSSCLNQYSFDVSTSSSFALFNSYLFAFSCIMFALTLLFWKF